MKKWLLWFVIISSLFGQKQYITITWNALSGISAIDGYTIFTFSSSQDTVNALDSIQVAPNVLEANFPNLDMEQVYYFRIIAYNSQSRSPISDPLKGIILSRTNSLVNPQVSVNSTQATITWSSLDPQNNILNGSTRIGQIKYSLDSIGLANGTVGTYSVEQTTSSLDFSITLSNLSPGSRYYYFIMENDTNGNLVTTDVLSFDVPVLNPDIYEPNDQFSEATNLPVPSEVQAYIYPANDQDFYQIQVPDSVDSLLILVSPPSGAGLDLNLNLYDSSQQLLMSTDNNGPDQGENLIFENPSPGIFYFSISENNGNSSFQSPYNLQIDVSYQDSSALQPNPDPYEENDSFGLATTFLPDSNYHAFMYPIGDNDFYQLQFAGDRIHLQLSNAPFPLQLEFYDSLQNLIGSDSTQNGSYDDELTLSSGEYVRIFPKNTQNESNTSSYVVRYFVVQSPPTEEIMYFAGPNPFVEGRTSDVGYHFMNLSEGMEIDIFSLSLEKIWSKKVMASDGNEIIWNLVNSKGQHIASGVYLVIIKDRNGKIVEQTKLIFIR